MPLSPSSRILVRSGRRGERQQGWGATGCTRALCAPALCRDQTWGQCNVGTFSSLWIPYLSGSADCGGSGRGVLGTVDSGLWSRCVCFCRSGRSTRPQCVCARRRVRSLAPIYLLAAWTRGGSEMLSFCFRPVFFAAYLHSNTSSVLRHEGTQPPPVLCLSLRWFGTLVPALSPASSCEPALSCPAGPVPGRFSAGGAGPRFSVIPSRNAAAPPQGEVR